MLRLPDPPPSLRSLSNEEFARLKAKFPRMPLSPAECPTCRGAGSFRWWHYEGTSREVAEYECDCSAQWLLYLYLLNANIGDLYQRLSWHDATAVEAGAIAKASAYLDKSDAYVRAGFGLILYGNKGAGKTMLSSLVLKRLLADGYDGYFTTFSEMVDYFTGSWYDRDEKEWFHRRIKNAGVLVVDDIGKEYAGRKESDVPRAAFDEIFRHRVAAATPTFLTTNLDMTGVHNTYGEHIVSLMRERATTYKFTGEDFREGGTSNRLHDEIELGLTRPVTIG